MKKRAPSPPPLRKHRKIPYKTILLALLLTISGVIFFSVGMSHYGSGNYSDWSLYWLLGALVFIPGSYHLFIFLQLMREAPGYSYDMLPDFDD